MRIRSIKPDFFLDEDLDRVDERHQKLFQGLWCLADCEGRLGDSPTRIRAQVFPYRPEYDVDAMLQVLHDGGFIDRYEASGIKCICVRNFRRHQRPHPKEPALGLPHPPKEIQSRGKKWPTIFHPVESPLQAGGKGREGSFSFEGALNTSACEPPHAAPTAPESHPPTPGAAASSTSSSSAGSAKKPADPRHHPLKLRLVAAYLQLRGVAYSFEPKDAVAIARLLARSGDDADIEQRWRRALADPYRGTGDLATFTKRFNDFGGAAPPGRGAERAPDIRRGNVRAETQNHGPPGEHAL